MGNSYGPQIALLTTQFIRQNEMQMQEKKAQGQPIHSYESPFSKSATR